MGKSDKGKVAESEDKIELAVAFFAEAVRSHMRQGLWGTIAVSATVEAGFVKEVNLDSHTTARAVPAAKTAAPDLTNAHTAD